MNTQSQPKNQLVLFQAESSFDGVGQFLKATDRKNNDGAVTGLTISVESRKVIAKALDVKQKSSKVTEMILATSDAIKANALREVVLLASSNEWTGASVRVTKDKSGTVKKSFVFKSVDRTPAIKVEDIAAAMANMTDEEQTKILNMAENIKAGKTPVEMVPAPDNSKAELVNA